MKVKNYLSDMAEKLQPYTWEFGSGKEIRFNSNTLPVPPKSLKQFLKQMEEYCPINEYADPTYADLKRLLADYEKVSIDNLTITNSGDEAIDILAKTFLNPEDKFIVTPPTYEMFSIQCEINRGEPVAIPLEKDTWNVNAEEIIKVSKDKKVKLIFLCNPNNPTGSVIDSFAVEKIVKESDAIVVIDETYREFYGKSSNYLLEKYINVVILRSFSKFAGMAGARIGYLIAAKEVSEKFDAIRFPMGVSFFSYKLAEEVLKKDQKWMQDQANMIKKERAKMTDALSKLGFIVYPSEANFLLVNMGSQASKIFKHLKEKGIIIRDRNSKKYLKGCVRITIRSPKENNMFISEIKKIITASNNQKYAFIDRDGTLIFEPQDTFQIDSLDKLKILDGVIQGLQKLIKMDFQLVMITNQDGLGTKSFPKENFEAPQQKMLKIFKKNGITFNEIFICPHFPEENCACRKPKLGLLNNFLKKNNLDREKSLVIGDRKTDKLFAENMGITFVKMQTNGNFYNAVKSQLDRPKVIQRDSIGCPKGTIQSEEVKV